MRERAYLRRFAILAAFLAVSLALQLTPLQPLVRLIGPRSVSAAAVTLTDIQGNWAEANIKALVARGITTGYPGGLFKPQQTLTRAEFATFVCRTIGQGSPPQAADYSFPDAMTHWAKDYVQYLVERGLLVPQEYNRRLGPDQPITRLEIAVLAARALLPDPNVPPSGQPELTFDDREAIGAQYRQLVSLANLSGIITGYPDNTFRPANTATRAEAATVLVRLLGALERTGAGNSGQEGSNPPPTTGQPGMGIAPYPDKERVREILALAGEDPGDVDRYLLAELEQRHPGLEDILNLSFSGLTYFPISLDKLYWEDNPQVGAAKGMGFDPFANHLNVSHPYGPGAWYMHPNRRLPIVLPADAVLTDWQNKSLNETVRLAQTDSRYRGVYDGVQVYHEAALSFQLAPDLYAMYGHLAIPKALVDELMTQKVLHLKAGEVIGYVESWPTPEDFMTADFRIIDLTVNNQVSARPGSWVNHLACPLTYFTAEMQSKIKFYYDKYTYAQFIRHGQTPEPWIDGPLNINIPDTVWGVWYHQSGLVPGLQGAREEYPRAILSFLHPTKWNSETFRYRFSEQGVPLPSGLSGVYGESDNGGHSEITRYGNSYLFLVEGDGASGILKMENAKTGAIIFMKFAVNRGGDGELDNLLTIKYFGTLEAARADNLTDGTIVYSRQWEMRPY